MFLTKFLIAFGAFLLICTNLISTKAEAQYMPPGTYKETCKNISMIGPLLRAMCQKRDGSWKDSTIQYNRCEGDIWNDNGNLTCKERQYNVPKGSYKESCKNYEVEGNKLKAWCKRRDGSYHSTSINYKNCKGDIWNDNGNLSCNQPQSGMPKGSYKETCRGYYVEGNWLYAQCKKRDGGWRNSNISYKNCKGDIWNSNGQLACDQYSGAPKGSYKETCRGYYVEGNWLYAQCKKRDGSWRNSSIKYANCSGDIWNQNGNLNCN